jgi:hypothetical protein
MLPTSVYGNKIVVDYEDAMRTMQEMGGDECEAVRRLKFLNLKKFQIPILKLGLEFFGYLFFKHHHNPHKLFLTWMRL